MAVPNNIHPDVVEALDLVDASVFSGDSYYTPEGMAFIEAYIARWHRELTTIKVNNYYNDDVVTP